MKKFISLLLAAVMFAAVFAGTGTFAQSNISGDTNGDGNLDNKDVVTLFRFVSGNTEGAVAENCDFNNDGETDNKDVVSLFRALSSGITAPDPEGTEDTGVSYETTAGEEPDTEEITEPGENTEPVTEPETTEETEETDTEEITETAEDSEPDHDSTAAEDSETVTDSETEEVTKAMEELVFYTPGYPQCSGRLVYDRISGNALPDAAKLFSVMIQNYTGAPIMTATSNTVANKEIVVSSSVRPETAQMLSELNEGEYAVRVIPGEKSGEGKLLIAATTYNSAYTCAEYLLNTYYSEEKGLSFPCDLDIKGTEKEYTLIESSITKKVRDPFILLENGVYYVYGTGWKCFKNTSGSLEGSWKKINLEVNIAHPDTDGDSHWAPEVHKYNGSYYMFTTYFNSKTEHRGCIILKSDSPEGPFTEITDGFITPTDWDCIDGTFYIDPDGQPWMVFVHEWTSMPDGVGAFAAAKLSSDLTHFISEPIQLFKANEPKWSRAGVTDGCFMYTTKDGELLMLWSNFDASGYAVAVAKSSNGRLDGEWIHEKGLLYSKALTNVYDGGHAMIFTDTDGQMYIAFHSPNTATDDRKEIPAFLAVEEKDGMIVRAKVEKKD